MTTDRKQEILQKIQKLLELASGTPFSEEANTARAKADELMTIYTIESWELEQHKPKHEREQVTSRKINICEGNHAGKQGLMRLISAVGTHCRCRILHYYLQSNHMPYFVQLYGFPSDLDYAELLWTNLNMHLVRDMKPTLDPEKSFDENLVRFKEAGMKWKEMHPLLMPGVEFTHAIGVKYTNTYTRYCKEHNRPRTYANPSVFVRSYIEGFASQVDDRLWELRKRQREYENQRGPGTSLALVDRKKEVDDYYNSIAKGKSITLKQNKIDAGAYRSGVASAETADLGQTRVAQKKAIEG